MRAVRASSLVLATALLLGGCGTEGGDVASDDARLPTAADDLAAAAADAATVVDDLVGALPAEPRDRGELDVPVVTRCDETDPDAGRTVAVTRGIAFASDDADDILAAARAHLDARGVEGLRTVREDGDAPQLLGTYGDQAWQVSVLLGRSAGRGDVQVNTPCLPGELDR